MEEFGERFANREFSGCAEAKGFEQWWRSQGGVSAAVDRALEQSLQVMGGDPQLLVEWAPSAVCQLAQDFDKEGNDGKVGRRLLLDVEHAHFDGVAAKPGDGPAGVGPFRVEDPFRIQRADIALDAPEDASSVGGRGTDGFGDYAGGD